MYQIVLCTCPTVECAELIASHIVKHKLAACVNIGSPSTSIYNWEGEIQKASEIPLLIKTTSALFNTLSDTINSIHPYDVAEIIAIDIQQGNKSYLHWLSESLA